MTGTRMHTPWGYPQDIEELAEGIWRVSTAGHGGLKLSRERWEELPDVVRDSFLNADLSRKRTARNPSPGRSAGHRRRKGAGLRYQGSELLSTATHRLCSYLRKSGRWVMAATTTRPRPRSLPSTTTKLSD